MFGGNNILLVLTSQRLARIEFAGRGRRLRATKLVQCLAPQSGDLAASVALAMCCDQSTASHAPSRTVASKRSRVWILSQDVFCGRVDLPLDVALLLEENERDQALAIEAEAQSGISALNCELVARPANTQTSQSEVQGSEGEHASRILPVHADSQLPNGIATSWNVAQVNQHDLQIITQTLERFGASLVGLNHPAALELIANQLDWMGMPEENEWSQAQLQQLAEAWMAQARLPKSQQFWISGPVHQDSSATIKYWQVACMLLAIAGCGFTYRYRTAELQNIARDLKVAEQSQSAIEQANKQIRAAESQVSQLRNELEQVTANSVRLKQELVTRQTIENNRKTIDFASFFDALAATASDRIWIQAIDCHPTEILISGQALDCASVVQLATELERELSHANWEVQLPALKPAVNSTDDAYTNIPLTEFSVRLVNRFPMLAQVTSAQVASVQATSIQADSAGPSVASLFTALSSNARSRSDDSALTGLHAGIDASTDEFKDSIISLHTNADRDAGIDSWEPIR